MSGGLVHFTVSKDGEAINDDKVMDLPHYVILALDKAIYTHFGSHVPAAISYQVEVNDSNGGPLVDFSTKGKVGAFSVPDLTVTLKGKVYTVSFEEFEPNNMNGGKRRRNTRRQRSRRACRRNTRSHRR